MKNHYVLSLKLQAQTGLHKDYSASSYSKDNKLQLRSPVKIEDSCSSARNSKRSPNNRPYVYEPVKSGSFVSSLLSPNARYSNVGNFGFNANKPSLNQPKSQDKQISDAENHESSSKPSVSENPLANNYRDGLRSRENPLAHKDGVISPTGKSSLQESLKSNSVSNYYNLGSNLSGLAAEKNFSLEEAAERKASPPSRVIADYLAKVNSKHGGSKNEGGSTIKASLQASSSPKKSFLDHGKSKLVTSMVRKENLLAKLKSENIPHHEDITKPLVSPSYKKDTFFRQQQQQQQQQTSMFSNTSVTNIAGVSSPARKIESQTTKGYSYLRDRTNPKVDERPTATGHFNLKKEEKSGDDLLNRYFKNRQRPDSSFDKHHVHSIKSVDFYQSSLFGGEPRLSNSKILKNNQLDSMDAEDNKGKNESIISGKTTDEWNVLNEKSKKNFLNFHKIFAENNKKVSFNKDDSKNLSKAVASAVKTGEEEIQSVKPLETNSSARDLLNLDRWMTPSSLNEKPPAVVSNSELQESLLDSQQVPLKELGSRRYPNTTKHLERRRIDFTTSFEGQSTNEFESKGLSTTAMYKSGDGDSDSLGINRSMTPMQNDKSGSWVKKRKSRTLINDELEEKIAQLEKKRIDLYQGHQANDVLKNLYSRTTVGKNGESALSSRSGDKTEKGSAIKEAKIEELKTEGQLKTLYMRVKEGFEKMKAEKSAWVEERSQLLGKIDTLEKTVLDLRERLTISES